MLEYVPHGTLQQFLRQLRVGPLPTWYTNHLKTTLVDHSTASGHYHRQVAEDLMSVLIQVAEAGVRECVLSVITCLITTHCAIFFLIEISCRPWVSSW